MPTLYQRITELTDTETAITLLHYLESDISTDGKTKKVLLSEISDLIDNDIRADIIADAVTATIAQLTAAGEIATAGNMKMHASDNLPDGWLWCDNASLERVGIYADLFADIGTIWGSVDGDHFNAPDFRGIAPMGAGASAKLDDANGNPFARTLGVYQEDKSQGHYHNFNRTIQANTKGAAAGNAFFSSNDSTGEVLEPITDGVNGTPRTGTETNSANAGINFIIKY